MPGQVKVEDFEVFTLFRAAVLKFGQLADQSLASGESHIARIHAWLENEQASFWQSQLRKRTEEVARARDAVRQKKIYKDSSGRHPSAIEEEKHLVKCEKMVEEAQWKIDAVKRALPKLEKANDAYRGAVASLGRTVGGEIPRAVALLDRLAGSLEAYVQIETPSGAAGEAGAVGEATPFEEAEKQGTMALAPAEAPEQASPAAAASSEVQSPPVVTAPAGEADPSPPGPAGGPPSAGEKTKAEGENVTSGQ